MVFCQKIFLHLIYFFRFFLFSGIQHLLYDSRSKATARRQRGGLYSRPTRIRSGGWRAPYRNPQVGRQSPSCQEPAQGSRPDRGSALAIRHPTEGAQVDRQLHVRLPGLLVLQVLREAVGRARDLARPRDFAADKILGRKNEPGGHIRRHRLDHDQLQLHRLRRGEKEKNIE